MANFYRKNYQGVLYNTRTEKVLGYCVDYALDGVSLYILRTDRLDKYTDDQLVGCVKLFDYHRIRYSNGVLILSGTNNSLHLNTNLTIKFCKSFN